MTALPGVPQERPRLSFKADGALAVAILAVVAILVVPLPALVLDLLVAANMALSVVALLATLYVPKASRISAFPTLLLVAALARVSLAVAATRLILLHADAGSIIRSFGEFVVHGNYVVGVVIFVIITIVEFVVVARGGERVAEVAARFTLDALPGKQMAIDAEARAGTIDPDEARRRRSALDGESHFFGAMDGATKFIKGDVAASAVIAVVNVVGGFAVGVGQRGMDWEPALRKYALLTIGAGLAIQIPALLLATSAGILVTRVASEDGATLGVDLENQLFGNRRTLTMTAWFLLALAVVPGLPALPFAFTASVLFLLAWRRGEDRRTDDSLIADEDERDGSTRFAPVAIPWSVDISGDIARPFGRRSADRAALAERLRARVFDARGVLLPTGRVAIDGSLPDRHAVLSIHEVPAQVIALPADLPEIDVAEFVEDGVAPLLIDRAADFLGIAETKLLVDELERRSPATVRHVIPKAIDLPVLADVLRRLIDEGLSVKDLKGILEAVVRAPPSDRDAPVLAERVRAEMRRSITFALTGGNGKLRAFVLDSQIEEAVRGSITRGASGSYVSLSAAAVRDIVSAVERTLGKSDEADTRPVLLVPSDIRRFVREILETDFPRLRVIAHDELLPEIGIEPRGTVRIGGDDQS